MPFTTNTTNLGQTVREPFLEEPEQQVISSVSLSGSVNRTPERQKTASSVVAPITERQRYLYKFVMLVANGSDQDFIDIWHILTSTPTGISEYNETLNKKMKDYKTEILHDKLDILSAYDGLVDEIYNSLCGNTGLFSNITERGDPTKWDIYTGHMVHTVILEKVQGAAIKGRDHLQKLRNATNQLKKLIKKIDKFALHIDKALARLTEQRNYSVYSNVLNVQQMLQTFSAYLKLNLRAMESAINYTHDKMNQSSEPSIIYNLISGVVAEFHPEALKDMTPYRATPSTKRLYEQHITTGKRMLMTTIDEATPPTASEPTGLPLLHYFESPQRKESGASSPSFVPINLAQRFSALQLEEQTNVNEPTVLTGHAKRLNA